MPKCEKEEDFAFAEKIIYSVGLQFGPEMEILEFHKLTKEMEMVQSEEEPEPVELNSFKFFVQALSYFEDEADRKLSSHEKSPAIPVGSSSSRIEINAIKTVIIQDEYSSDWSKPLDESTSTREGSPDLLLGKCCTMSLSQP